MNESSVVNIDTQRFSINAAISTLSKRVAQTLFGISKDGKRNINEVYGYQPTLSFDHFYSMYSRGGIAARIINCVPRSCWRDGVQLIDNDEKILEKEIKILERYGKMSSKLERADIMNRIGKFSVLYVGVPDGLKPEEPLGKSRPNRLKEVYFAPYAEDGVEIVKWESDITSPRYGQPLIYQLQVQSRGDNDKAIMVQPILVHHTRVVHLAEGLLDNEIEGIPALQPVFNALEDLAKVTGGSAEAYFRNARNRFAMEVDPKFNSQLTDAVKTQMEEEAQRFQNDWQDFIRSAGMVIKPLPTTFSDPLNAAKICWQVVSGTTGIPIRILSGEGAGQLAGNEDKESYNQLITDRKELYCGDWAMNVMTILSNAKMIELPESAEILWSTPEVLSDTEKATNSSAKASALASVASALSTPALDGVLDVSKAMELVFGKDSMVEMELDESGNDGVDDEPETEEPAQNPLGTGTEEKPPVAEDESIENP